MCAMGIRKDCMLEDMFLIAIEQINGRHLFLRVIPRV